MKKLDLTTIGKLSAYLKRRKLNLAVCRERVWKWHKKSWHVQIDSRYADYHGYGQSLLEAIRAAVTAYETRNDAKS